MSNGTSGVDQQQRTVFNDVPPYVSVAYADSFMLTDFERSMDWAQLTADQKLVALKIAQRDMDEMTYIGQKLHYNQVREWPRYTDFRTLGDVFLSLEDNIPVGVANANVIQAWYRAKQFLRGERTVDRRDHQAQGVGSISRLNSSEQSDLDRARRHNLHPEVYRILLPYIAKTSNLEDNFFVASWSHQLRSLQQYGGGG